MKKVGLQPFDETIITQLKFNQRNLHNFVRRRFRNKKYNNLSDFSYDINYKNVKSNIKNVGIRYPSRATSKMIFDAKVKNNCVKSNDVSTTLAILTNMQQKQPMCTMLKIKLKLLFLKN